MPKDDGIKDKRIELDEDKLLEQYGAAHTVGVMLGIDYTGSSGDGYTRVRRQLRERIAGHTVVVHERDMLMHGDKLLEIAQLCYDYRAALEIKGDAKNVRDYLVTLMMSERTMSESIATVVVGQLFPDGTFLHNPKPEVT